jgi:hypothetical protein
MPPHQGTALDSLASGLVAILNQLTNHLKISLVTPTFQIFFAIHFLLRQSYHILHCI